MDRARKKDRRGTTSCRSHRKSFAKDARGSMSIKAVMWIPLFTFFILLVADVSNVYLKQSEAMRIIQDGNRALSINRLTSPLAAQTAIAQKLALAVPGATVTTGITGNTIITTASLPLRSMTMSSSLPFLGGAVMTVNARHMVEY
ncbi:MAG: Flp pilus assembly protein TadG [Limimaricola cinnabarinus]|jgi:Flp pilus assembly protein TadG